MRKMLSFILVLAIFISGCGASAPMETEAPAELDTTDLYSADHTDSESVAVESFPGSEKLTESAEAPVVSGAEYFSFTKYSNTITDDSGLSLLIENRCVPTFTSPDDARSRWVGELLDVIERDYKTDSTNLYTYALEFVEGNGTDHFYSYSNYQQMGVARHDETVVSLIALSSLYSGGSHPNSVQVAYNLDITGQRILRLEDVIWEESASALSRLVREGVDEKFAAIDGGCGLFEDYGDTIDGSMVYGNMTPYWYLNDQGLVIFYNQYELGPYAAGIIKVELPYAALEGILLPDYFPAQPDTAAGDLVAAGEGEGLNRIPIVLDQEDHALMLGVEGTVYQVQLSEVMWLEGTPISQDLRFSARSLSETDLLEITGGYADETRSFVIEFTDGRGERRLYHIRDGKLSENP